MASSSCSIMVLEWVNSAMDEDNESTKMLEQRGKGLEVWL